MSTETSRPIEILLVEDNPMDVRLAEMAFKVGRIANRLRIVNDGESALALLRREGEFSGSIRPDLILLDLHLPGMSGQDVLKEIREDQNLADLQVIVLTGSRSEEDLLNTYDLRVNCYINKPIDMNKLLDAVKSIKGFGLVIVDVSGVLPS